MKSQVEDLVSKVEDLDAKVQVLNPQIGPKTLKIPHFAKKHTILDKKQLEGQRQRTRKGDATALRLKFVGDVNPA